MIFTCIFCCIQLRTIVDVLMCDIYTKWIYFVPFKKPSSQLHDHERLGPTAGSGQTLEPFHVSEAVDGLAICHMSLQF